MLDLEYCGCDASPTASIAVEIVKRKANQVGFAVQPNTLGRRTLLLLDQTHRRLWKDAEATIESAMAFLCAAAVMIFIRYIARHS